MLFKNIGIVDENFEFFDVRTGLKGLFHDHAFIWTVVGDYRGEAVRHRVNDGKAFLVGAAPEAFPACVGGIDHTRV